MKNLEICLSPTLLPHYQLEGKIVVVVDIFRATSCMVAGLASGVRRIRPVAALDEARALMAQGYIGAGERDGHHVEGFHIGNSPLSYMDPAYRGCSIATTTTNGTQAIEHSRAARQIVVGAFLNLSAVAQHLAAQPHSAVVVCAGWKGRVNLEDTLFAGALARKLDGTFGTDDDSVLAAQELYANMQEDLFVHLQKSSHYQRLTRLGIKDDIHFCLEIDRFAVVPHLAADGHLVI
ncbi:MAG: 2-phosphosulfolactate phosphatase [Bernardetiaceae bacterium]|jgi:2-phosphosulfolactate phosphatase|nr:2-phosphosulfolactate phosphatase [Bernardetiaceae bacterium]